MFSDFDFIAFVEDDYKIPNWLEKEPSAKPFPDDNLNLAYRNKKFIDGKYDVEIFFVRRKTMNNSKTEKLAEECGIPFSEDSKLKHIVVYSEDWVKK